MRSIRHLLQFIVLPAFILASQISIASDLTSKKRDQTTLRNHLWAVEQAPAQLAASVKKGKKKAEFCVFCHGNDGISRNDWEPNLAGQNSTYLIDQMIRFATNKRKNLVMNDLISKFTDGELVDIALYFSSLENNYTPANVDASLIAKGKTIYQKSCTACHGINGVGNAGFASLGGQKTQYLVNALKKFKGDSRRSSDIMAQLAEKLSDTDIKAVATYLTAMNVSK